MGGVDKGWVELAGAPMIVHVLQRLAPQVGEIRISANQNLDRYRALGHPVFADTVGGFAGPLAGLHAGIANASRDLVVTVPCDSPSCRSIWSTGWPAQRSSARWRAIAVARTFDQPHPVFALARRDVLPSLSAFLEGGGRKIDAWYAALDVVEVAFDDEADAFRNINTNDELLAAARP